MIFSSNPKLRLLGILDLAALLAIVVVSGLFMLQDDFILIHFVTFAFVGLWVYKIWILSDVLGVWFPARFGMNGSGIYEMWFPWAVFMIIFLGAILYIAGESILAGDTLGALTMLPLICAVGRAIIPHIIMGWLTSRRMTARPSGGE